jgi:hypothetical protein
MNSSTSSEDLPIKLIDDKVKSDEKTNKNDIIKLNDKNDKKETEDTDLYFNLIANDVKKQPEPKSSSSAISVSSSSSKKTSSVKRRSKKSSSSSNSSSSRRSNSSSSRKSSSSKAKFDKIKTNSKTDHIRNNFINSTNNFQQPIPVLNPQEDKMKKIELLRRLSEIKAKGYELSKSYDFNSSIKEMEYEYELLRSFADKRNGIRLYKNILLNTTSVIEFLNDRYDPFSFQLSGWSEHMSVECDSYEDVLEELYEKYKGNGKRMSPELKLFLLIMASASAFHFSKSTYNKMPMMESLLKKNPGFVANMINPKKQKSQFMTEQEIHLEKQKEMIRERERNKRKNISTKQPVSKPEKKVRQNMFAAENARKKVQLDRNSLNINHNHNIPRENMESKQINRIFNENTRINPPENVNDILKRLHERRDDSIGATTQEESSISNNNDRVVSDSTLTSDTAGRKKRRARKKKSLLTII